jgi:hypothetical protein
METPADQDSQEREAAAPLQDPQDHPDHPDPTEDPESPAAPVHQEPPPRAKEVEPELQDQLETPERQDSQDPLDSQDSPEAQDRLDPRDHPEDPDNPAPMATPALPDPPDSREALARRESAPSTAPSTEESSSRTEPAAVKQSKVFQVVTSHPFSLCPTAFTSYCHPPTLLLSHRFHELALTLLLAVFTPPSLAHARLF